MRKILGLGLVLCSFSFIFWGFGAKIVQAQQTEAEEVVEEQASNTDGTESDEGQGDEGVSDGSWGDEGNKFGEIKIELNTIEEASPQLFSWGGFIKEELAYSYQKPEKDYAFLREETELSKMRTTLNLDFDWKIAGNWKLKVSGNAFYDDYYRQKNREGFPKETLNAYEQEAEFRDTFIEGPLYQKNLWLKVGRQIIAWGESEGTPIIDMVNPRDSRELGQVDLEDTRIPMSATKLSWIFDSWEINAVAVHEIRVDKIGTYGSDYDPYIRLRGPTYTITEDEVPESTAENTEWLFRVFKSFNGGDLSFVYADVVDNSAYLDLEQLTIVPVSFTEFVPYTTLVPKYRRIKVTGMSLNRVKDSLLFKLEFAAKSGKAYARNDMQQQVLAGVSLPKSWSEKDVLQGLLGLEYTITSDLVLSLESESTQIESYEENLASDEISTTSVAILRYNNSDQTVQTQFIWINLPADNGDLFRFSIDYDYVDALTFSASVVVYEASDEAGFVYPYRNNDRLLSSVKYSF
ncbi:DUF1302 family protein [Deltaproteobacteria bacterium TL4]